MGPVGAASRGDYVQDKVRPGTGREGDLGYVRRDYVQDERYFAIEHMDVRREAFQVCTGLKKELASSGATPSYRPLR